MSMDIISASERVCYVQCNFCNTMLAVSVPCSGVYNWVTVRCGHCANLLSVNLVPSPAPSVSQDFQDEEEEGGGVMEIVINNEGRMLSAFLIQIHLLRQHHDSEDVSKVSSVGSSSSTVAEDDDQQPRTSHIRPPEKRQRVPSAYNKFIKEEIQRIKASNPEISHREAFSAAAKNWAHFPHIHFGLNIDGQKQGRLDHTLATEGTNKSHGYY